MTSEMIIMIASLALKSHLFFQAIHHTDSASRRRFCYFKFDQLEFLIASGKGGIET